MLPIVAHVWYFKFRLFYSESDDQLRFEDAVKCLGNVDTLDRGTAANSCSLLRPRTLTTLFSTIDALTDRNLHLPVVLKIAIIKSTLRWTFDSCTFCTMFYKNYLFLTWRFTDSPLCSTAGDITVLPAQHLQLFTWFQCADSTWFCMKPHLKSHQND